MSSTFSEGPFVVRCSMCQASWPMSVADSPPSTFHLVLGTLVPRKNLSFPGFWELKLKSSACTAIALPTKLSPQSLFLIFLHEEIKFQRGTASLLTLWPSWDFEPGSLVPGSQQPCPSASPRPPVKRVFPGFYLVKAITICATHVVLNHLLPLQTAFGQKQSSSALDTSDFVLSLFAHMAHLPC